MWLRKIIFIVLGIYGGFLPLAYGMDYVEQEQPRAYVQRNFYGNTYGSALLYPDLAQGKKHRDSALVHEARGGDHIKHRKLLKILILGIEDLFSQRVLTVDGGGIRGVLPITILEDLEHQTGLFLRDLFKAGITGTSTGALIALCATKRDNPMSASDIAQLYEEMPGYLFPQTDCHVSTGSVCCTSYAFPSRCITCSKTDLENCCEDTVSCLGKGISKIMRCQRADVTCQISAIHRCFLNTVSCVSNIGRYLTCGCCFGIHRNCEGYCGPKYNPKARKEYFREQVGDQILGSARVPVQVTTYDLKSQRVVYLSSHRPVAPSPDNPDTSHYLMLEAALATSAAPTYYSPEMIGDGTKERPYRKGIDGGTFQNNPLIAALKFVRQCGRVPKEIDILKDLTIVSLGTGETAGQFYKEELETASAVEWVRPILTITMDGASQAVQKCYEEILSGRDYFRIQPRVNADLMEMDRPENVAPLILTAQDYLTHSDSQYRRLIDLLEQERQFLNTLEEFYSKLSERNFLYVLMMFAELQTDYQGKRGEQFLAYYIKGPSNSEDVAHYGQKEYAEIFRKFNSPRFFKILKYVTNFILQDLLTPHDPSLTRDDSGMGLTPVENLSWDLNQYKRAHESQGGRAMAAASHLIDRGQGTLIEIQNLVKEFQERRKDFI